MNWLIYILFLTIFFTDYIYLQMKFLPRFITWLPELVSVVIAITLLLRFSIKKQFNLSNKYIVLLSFYITIILMGVIVNSVPAGPIFVGLRVYFKTLPLFLLPFIYKVSESELKKQFKLLGILLVCECGLAFYQRCCLYSNYMTGDVVKGTLDTSSALSIVMLGGVAVSVGLTLYGKIKKRVGIPISLIFIMPTTINETKATFIFVPVILLCLLLFCKGQISDKLRRFVTIGALCLAMGVSYVYIDTYFTKAWRDYNVIEFFTKKKLIEKYVYTGSDLSGEEKVHRELRRADFILAAHKKVSRDSITLLFGFGIGNAMDSYLGSFRGEHTEAISYGGGELGLTHILWELGYLGVAVHILFLICFFYDSVIVARQEDFCGGIALGWSGFVLVIMICLIYKNTLVYNVINYLFWYISGVLVARFEVLKYNHSNTVSTGYMEPNYN